VRDGESRSSLSSVSWCPHRTRMGIGQRRRGSYNPYRLVSSRRIWYRRPKGSGAKSNLIFQQALAEWRSLPPPTLTGQPPTLQGTGLSDGTNAGQADEFRPRNISVSKNQACASLSHAVTRVHGPIPSVNLTMVRVSRIVSISGPGKRTAQAILRYAPWFPITPVQRNTRPVLWRKLLGTHGRPDTCCRIPDADQAQHPPVDTQEMGLPDTACIAFRLSPSPIPISLRVGVGSGLARYQVSARR